MNCPKCNASLETNQDRGVEMEECPNCRGMWFSKKELDEFEDTAI